MSESETLAIQSLTVVAPRRCLDGLRPGEPRWHVYAGGGWRCGMYPCSRRPVVRLEGWASGLRSGGCPHSFYPRRGGIGCSPPAARAARGSAQASPCGRAAHAKCAGRAWRVWSRLWLPTQARPNRHTRSAELPCQSPFVHTELLSHRRKGGTPSVASRGPVNRVIGHLADDAPSSDAGPVEVVDNSGPVQFVPTSECIDRLALAVAKDQLIGLSLRQPPLDRV